MLLDRNAILLLFAKGNVMIKFLRGWSQSKYVINPVCSSLFYISGLLPWTHFKMPLKTYFRQNTKIVQLNCFSSVLFCLRTSTSVFINFVFQRQERYADRSLLEMEKRVSFCQKSLKYSNSGLFSLFCNPWRGHVLVGTEAFLITCIF